MGKHVETFKELFKPFVIDIQNHGRYNKAEYVYEKINDAYVENVESDFKTFLCSDLLRSQVLGLMESLEEGSCFSNFARKDFSQTGAARTMALDVKKMVRKWINICLTEVPGTFDT